MEFRGTEHDLLPAVPSRFGPLASKKSQSLHFTFASHPNGLSERNELIEDLRLRASDPGMGRLQRGREALVRAGRLPHLDPDGQQDVVGVHRRNMASSLFQAVATSRYSQVQFLLNNGVETNVVNDAGQNLLITCLYVYDQGRRARMFKYLLRKGVDPYYTDHLRRSVLSWACLLGRPKEALAILNATMGELDLAQGDKDGKTPLHHATISGHEEVVMVLLKHMDKYKLDVDVPDGTGLTPFIYARRLGFNEIAHALVTVGHASRNQFDTVSFKSAEDWALIGAKERAYKYKRECRRQVAFNKMYGKLPPLGENIQSPSLNIRMDNMSGDPDSVFTSESLAKAVSTSSKIHDRKNAGTKKMTNTTAVSDQNNSNIAQVTGNRIKHTSDSSEELLTSGSNSLSHTQDSVNSTFTHLLDLQTVMSDSSVNHPTSFVNSELDNAKASKLGIMGNLNEMMAILSDQTSGAFCAEAIPRPPSPVKELSKKKKKKKNVSTLAILMSGDPRANGARKGKKPAAGLKEKKSLTDHAKAKKRKSLKLGRSSDTT